VRTLDELERHDGAEISEEAIESWLNAIYDDPAIRDPWKKAYTEQFQLAEYLLRTLRPFESDQQLEQKLKNFSMGLKFSQPNLKQNIFSISRMKTLLKLRNSLFRSARKGVSI